jgi:hypothetical protein
MPDGVHRVEYNGRGFYERVTADAVVLRKTCWYWFVPRFDFALQGPPAVLEVRVWPWLQLRSLVLRVGGHVVYAEGIDGAVTPRAELPLDPALWPKPLRRPQITVRGMMWAVALAAFACFFHEQVCVGQISQCGGGRMVPIEFVLIDAETGTPVPRAKLTLSGRGTRHHELETGPDGRTSLSFQPGCDERTYLLWGTVYTVHFSRWKLSIEAEGYDRVNDNLSRYRADVQYPHRAVPSPILVRMKRRETAI